MLCSLGEGREEGGFPPRSDGKLENTEPAITLLSLLPQNFRLLLTKREYRMYFNLALFHMSISLGDCKHLESRALFSTPVSMPALAQ